VAGLVLVVTAAATLVFWRSGTPGAEKANVLALPVAVVGVLLTVWQLRARPDLNAVARSVAEAVSADRTAFLSQALGPARGNSVAPGWGSPTR
jgi:hypothetical protein